MKRCGLICLLLVGLGAVVAHADPIVAPGARVAVCGDSITEQRQYCRFIEDYLLACQPQLHTINMQFGWGGDTARGFDSRYVHDMMPFKPTLVTTCYGMNDGGYRAFTDDTGKNYQAPMTDLVTKLKAAGVTVLVGGPGAVDTKTFRNDPAQAKVYNETLGQLSDIAHKIATDNGMPFADVHGALIDAMGKAKAALGEDFQVCGGDGVHPGSDGHLVMAYAYLKAMGFDGDLGTITVDMKGPATATGGHKVLGGANGTAQIESSRYPFCFWGSDKDSNGTVSILPFVPFNQDLNRLTLIVKNLDAAQAKVTWGDQSKTFAKADLEKGINLAAEFLVNPFSQAFAKLDGAVAQKENYETFLVKSAVSPWRGTEDLLKAYPDILADEAALQAKLWAVETKYAADMPTHVTPVQHTITVAPA
jgi:lysophospholipase L1-like esterase